MAQTPHTLIETPGPVPDGVLDQLVDALRSRDLSWRHFGPDVHVDVTAQAGRTPFVAVSAGEVAVDRPNHRDATVLTAAQAALLLDGAGPIRLRANRATFIAGSIRFPPLYCLLTAGRLPGLVRLTSGAVVPVLVAEAASDRPGAGVVVDRLIDVLMVEFVRACLGDTYCPSGTLRPLQDSAIARSLALIHRWPERPWRIEDLAKRVQLSRSAFAARFRTLTGTSPADYLTHWRIHRAATALRSEPATIAQIARRAGYGSEAAFTRAFKRIVGVSPGAFRAAAASPDP
jgi:AraC-like DNA-binding protein